jgi:hypothetical protein
MAVTMALSARRSSSTTASKILTVLPRLNWSIFGNWWTNRRRIDREAFAVAMFLLEKKLLGRELPDELLKELDSSD